MVAHNAMSRCLSSCGEAKARTPNRRSSTTSVLRRSRTSEKELAMDRHNVESSNIRSIGYDPATQKLEVEFHKSGVYEYLGVSFDLYREFCNAKSKGIFLNERIRGKFDYKCLTPKENKNA